mmetsp:Transcript_13232/g.35564  ORF Transcript_13232/g.35564 Transcript_13232/m.35564 type:complete len:939 (+) Transcript_13232:75-2891(+)
MSVLRGTWSKRAATACWLHAADELTIEVLAQVKYDAYVVDAQHGMSQVADAVRQLRALQAMSQATALVRITELSAKEIGSYLDAGFAGVICPMVNTKAQAQALVSACRYAPEGDRSWGPTRAVLKSGGSLPAYYQSMISSSSKPIVLAMIETAEGLANLSEIVNTDIDGVFIGPMDLSLALGEPCAGTNGKKTKQAIAGIAARAQQKGKIVGIYVSDRESIEYYIAKGFQFVVCAHDKVALMAGAKASLPQARKRVRTTHVGSLPRPDWLVPIVRGEQAPPPDYAKRLHEATVEVMQKQLDAGLDEINDGELGRRDYVTAARQRMSGFGGKGQAAAAADLVEMKDFSEKLEGRKGLLTLTEKTEVTTASCNSPVAYTPEGFDDLHVEMNRVKAAAQELGVPMSRVFFSSPSPGTLANFFGNEFYETHEEYVGALAAAMATEYKAIHEAGFKLQVDCPDLAMGRHTRFAKRSLAEFQKAARFHVEVMNKALEGLDSSKIRMHVCWGNYPGPHHHDVALADIAEIIMSASPKFISIEACNPGHAHEHEVWKNVKVPADKVLMPGVLDTTTSHIEHPRLVAQRLQAYAQAVGGMDRIMACTDCGFSTAAGALNLTRDIVYSKMASMVKGAASLADSSSKKVAKLSDMTELDCALLDAWMPGHERTTTLLMGHIVTNTNSVPHLGDAYGYNLTYNAMASQKGNALHRHPSIEIFVNLDAPFEFAYGKHGQHKVTLQVGDAIAVPAGVTHSYKNVMDGHPSQPGRILTVLPGRPSITWDDGVVARARKMGAKCSDTGILIPEGSLGPEALAALAQMEQSPTAETDATEEDGKAYVVRHDSGSELRLESDDGWLELSWLRLNRGRVVELDPRVETVAVVIYGSVCCGENLQALDAVKQPSFFSAAEDSLVLLIKSSLPHDMDFFFGEPRRGQKRLREAPAGLAS